MHTDTNDFIMKYFGYELSHAVFTRFVIDMDVFNNDTYDSFSLFNNALYKLIVFCID